MGTMASQITSLSIVYWTVYTGAEQRKHESLDLLSIGPQRTNCQNAFKDAVSRAHFY